jgi:hypothetical protein
MLYPDFREFIELLKKNDVRYLLVGGYAVTIYGHPRNTGDIDIWIDRENENLERLMRALIEFGFGNIGIDKNDFLKKDNVIQLGFPPVRIDILTDLDGLQFESSYNNREVKNFEGIDIAVISLPDLLINKKAIGRHIDLDDIRFFDEKI